MAEHDPQERTESATPKRREEARRKGQIARSRELNSTSVMLAGSGALLAFGPYLAGKGIALFHEMLHLERSAVFQPEQMSAALGSALVGTATAGADLPGTPTGGDVSAALWSAAGAVYTATKGQGRLIVAAPPSMLGVIGPLFAPVNPTNAFSTGFNAGQFGTGAMGAISGIQVVVTNGLAADEMLVLSSAAVEVYEDRIGSLQVVEPSVLGVQVAYAGYYTPLVIEPTGIIKIVK